MKTTKENVFITITVSLVVFLILLLLHTISENIKGKKKTISVGFVYEGDASTPYTGNFIQIQKKLEEKFEGKVKFYSIQNVSEKDGSIAINELINYGCNLIFTTSYGYLDDAKNFAEKYPEIQFCQATGDNANKAPILNNYHTFMGEIYQGRYVAGIVAGIKLKELIDEGTITADQAKIGYIGAYPYPEVISGYTAFLLGILTKVPQAKMEVKYTNSWNNFSLEKQYAAEMIDNGCVIISQHSDTIGPAIACEEKSINHVVFHVGYNQSMIDVAPTTSIISTKINWEPYIKKAIMAVMENKKIEKAVKGNVHGNDIGAGFDLDWVQIIETNSFLLPPETQSEIENTIQLFKKNKLQVFKGNYLGINPDNQYDFYNLTTGYEENKTQSAPSFYYLLDGYITIVE